MGSNDMEVGKRYLYTESPYFGGVVECIRREEFKGELALRFHGAQHWASYWVRVLKTHYGKAPAAEFKVGHNLKSGGTGYQAWEVRTLANGVQGLVDDKVRHFLNEKIQREGQ